MSILKSFMDLFGSSPSVHDINPGSGLPMLDDTIDVAGNPFGTDHLSDDLVNTSALDDDLFSSSSSGFDDW